LNILKITHGNLGNKVGEVFDGTSKAHFLRAKELLNSSELSDLLYCGLELRFGIEARLQEYKNAHIEIKNKKARGWKISEMAKTIESAFNSGDSHIIFTVFEAETNEIISKVHYTPVTGVLQNIAKKSGNYLDYSKKDITDSEDWWEKYRTFLKEGIEELEYAVSGQLMGPPLQKKDNPKEMHFVIDGDRTKIFPPGKK
jgi:hypothetical protein